MKTASPLLVVRDLVGLPVVDADGKRLGTVIDLVVDVPAGWEVASLELGRHRWLDRLGLLRALSQAAVGHEPRTVAWRDVERLADGSLILRRGAIAVNGGGVQA